MTSVAPNPETVNPDVQAMIDEARAWGDEHSDREILARIAEARTMYAGLAVESLECNGKTIRDCRTHGCHADLCLIKAAGGTCDLPHRGLTPRLASEDLDQARAYLAEPQDREATA